LFFAAFCLLTISNVGATTYYVATTGNNSAAGTMAQPFATLQKGNDVAVAGDTFISGAVHTASLHHLIAAQHHDYEERNIRYQKNLFLGLPW